MELVSFTVRHYRSILKAYKLPIGSSTILVGPNNEGKSNILKALVTAMRVLASTRWVALQPDGTFPGWRLDKYYVWERDYPIALQKTVNQKTTKVIKDKVSEFVLEFRLTPEEVEAFRRRVRSQLNGTLPLRIIVGQRKVMVTVHKKGPGGAALSKKSREIADFVAKRLDFDYIPAIRTAESAQEIVDQLVERELQKVEEDPKYQAALAEIAAIQRPILEKLGLSINETLKQFLPTVKSVQFHVQEDKRNRAMRRSCEIIIDDGTATKLQYKGDGAQSLAALGIMRYVAEQGANDKALVIALEEPESHLHPRAIHALRNVVAELAQRHQVVISTHCPLFVERVSLKSNIIVQDGRATPAATIDAIRDALGVRAADNLRHAEIVLLVEGEDDRRSVSAILRATDSELATAIDGGVIAVDSLAGGGNLTYKATLVRDALCLCHCFLDADDAAIRAFESARISGVLRDGDVQFSTVAGRDEAEFEDMLDDALYEPAIQQAYRVSLLSPKFKGRKKWSDRVKECFQQQGRIWNDRIEMQVKALVAELVESSPSKALQPQRRGSFDALVAALKARLKEIAKAR